MLQLEFLPHFSPQFSVLHCRYFYFHYFAGLSVGLKAACEAEAARAASEVIMNAIKLYRIGHWFYKRRIPIIPRLIYYLIYLTYNASIPMAAEIGEGTKFGYGGMGVVVHSNCRIGRKVFIAHQVTICSRRAPWHGVPMIEDNCFIGVGAKILGPIHIGTGSDIGANAVVVHDVPPHSVVAGVPARVIRKDIKIEDYYDWSALWGR